MKPTNNAEVSGNQMTPFGKKMRDLPAERRVFSAFLMEVGSGFDPTELVKRQYTEEQLWAIFNRHWDAEIAAGHLEPRA
jgi:hypothetical protein